MACSSNGLFKDKSFYFRNALVRANYENQKLDVAKTLLPLEEFFKVLIFGCEIELKNRFLRIGQEYGSKAATAIADMHRADVVKDVAKESTLTAIEEMAVKANRRYRQPSCPSR